MVDGQQILSRFVSFEKIYVMKFIRFLLLFFCLGLIPICCCHVKSRWNFVAVSLFFRQGSFGEPLTNDNEIHSDTAYLWMVADPLFVQNRYSLSTTEPLFGTSCPFPGDEGLIDSVVSIQLFSDASFNNVPSGESLNQKVLVSNYYPLDSMPIYTNHSSPESWNSPLFFLEKPALDQPHTFTLRITQQSGKIIEAQSPTVVWK